MKQGYILLPGLALALTLAGCAGAARPLGEKQPDLVVYNDSTAIIGSITVSSDRESQGVAMGGRQPAGAGESYGFQVAETERVTVSCGIWNSIAWAGCQVKMEEQPCGLRWMMNWA